LETDDKLHLLRLQQFLNLTESWYGSKAVEEYVKKRDKTDAMAF